MQHTNSGTCHDNDDNDDNDDDDDDAEMIMIHFTFLSISFLCRTIVLLPAK